MSLRIYKKHVLSLFCMTVATFPAIAQTDSLFLTIDQLFERGVRHSLQIQADVLKESIAQERTHTARSAQLPDLQIGLKGGYVGQPILFEQGLAHPTRPEAPRLVPELCHRPYPNRYTKAVKSVFRSGKRIWRKKSPLYKRSQTRVRSSSVY